MIESFEAMVIDTLECGVSNKEVMKSIVKLGNRCLDEELYEFMKYVTAAHELARTYIPKSLNNDRQQKPTSSQEEWQ